MSQDDLFAMLASDELFFDHEEFEMGFRSARGSYSRGMWESDPEMNEYEETVELGRVLACA
jgi:hypothetical protein